MRAVVVIAHPDPASFTHAVAARVVAGLAAGGHVAVVHDLHADGFRAAMSDEERQAYHGDRPIVDPLVRRYADDVLAADALVFVQPCWWGGLPALSKGWLERVLVPGVGFVFDEAGAVRPGLRHVRRIVGVSTYGSRRLYVRAVNDGGRRTILRALRLCTGVRTRSRWLGMYSLDTSTARDRERFLARCERACRSLR